MVALIFGVPVPSSFAGFCVYSSTTTPWTVFIVLSKNFRAHILAKGPFFKGEEVSE